MAEKVVRLANYSEPLEGLASNKGFQPQNKPPVSRVVMIYLDNVQYIVCRSKFFSRVIREKLQRIKTSLMKMEMNDMADTNQMPWEEGIDHSLSLMREGYMYILNRRKSFNSNVFETRLLGKKAICMVGKEAAKVFYDTEKFKRKDAAPNRAVQTLFGKNGVQALDGQDHKHRKEMFMSIMSPKGLQNLTNITKKQWKTALNKWEQMDKVILYEEVKEIMCRTACQWAGVPLEEEDVKKMTKDLAAMFESPAAVGPNHWLGRNARNNVEK